MNIFKSLFGNPQFTPPITPSTGAAQAPSQAKPVKAPSKWGGRLDIIGGALKDLDWTSGGGHMDTARGRQQSLMEAYEAKKRIANQKALLAQATQGMTPQQQAVAQINPAAFSSRQINNQFQDPLAVKASDRADMLAQNTVGNTQFNQNMATQQFDYGKGRDAIVDGRYEDETKYSRGRDQTNDAWRQDRAKVGDNQWQQTFNAGQGQNRIQNDLDAAKFGYQKMNGDRSYELAAQQAAQGPKIPPALAYKMQQDQEQKDAAAKDVEDAKNSMISDLSRLRGDGDLAPIVGKAFGMRVPFAGSVAGSDTANVRATVKKVVSNLTLDKIKNFKGAISDKDLEVAESAATILQNPNITDKEAKKEIDRLFTALGGVDETPLDFGSMSDDELRKMAGG